MGDSLPDGAANALSRGHLTTLVAEYNRQRGWVEEGWLTPDDAASIMGSG